MDNRDYTKNRERAQQAADDIVGNLKAAGKELDNMIRDYKDTSISKIKVDVLEDDKNYYIKADIPGAEKDNVKVTIEGQNVIITCKFESFEDELKEIADDAKEETEDEKENKEDKKEETEDEKEEPENGELKYIVQGRIRGTAKKIIPLTKKIKTKETKAKYNKGTVTLTIPKVKPKSYKVTVE